MSYILDALKKSDQERKRGDVPGLQTVHIPLTVEQSSPRILYGFIVILLLVLAFVVGLLASRTGDQPELDKQQVDIAPDAVQPVPEVALSATVEPSPEQVYRPELVAPKTTTYREKKPLIAEVAESNTKPQIAVSQGALDAKIDVENIPHLHELPAYKQQSIPEFDFAGHVYSSTPLNRSVIINGAAMSEGDNIMPGLELRQITPSGVIFSLQGEHFRVDILQDWSFE